MNHTTATPPLAALTTPATTELAAYERDGHSVSRAAFYALACDPHRSVAVEACAGAGKTWMLVSRILRALLDGAQPHEILAITFTRKAAGEMRQRLHEWLTEFAQASPERLHQELTLRGLPPALATQQQAALGQLYASVLAAGRSVQIRTFHSWFISLLRTAPISVLQALGLPTHYQLLEDDSEAVRLVWRRFHDAVAADPACRADFEALVAEHGRFQTAKALHTALNKRTEFALADAAGVVAQSVLAFGAQFPALAGLHQPQDWLHSPACRAVLLPAAQALGQAKAATFAAKGSELEQAVTAQDWPGVVAALLTQKGEPRKFSDKVAGLALVRTAQAAVQEVEAAQAQHQAWLYQQRMLRLTRQLLADFAAIKRENGWVDMNDVERAAQVVLSSSELSGWVQEKLDARIRHLLIDEFQDTNPLQWQALHAWLSGYAGTGGGQGAPSVFIVGDPKQSIYRFRRAEPQVFRAAQAFVRDGLGGVLLSCDHTRRNAQGVIALVNQVMGQAQTAGEYPGFREHTTESHAHGSVLALPQIPRNPGDPGDPAAPRDAGDADIEPAAEADTDLPWRDSLHTPRLLPEDSLRSRECRQAAHWLAARIAAGLHPRDIMVLSRRRAALALMEEELRRLHLPTQQPEKTDLADAPEVQDLIALLDVLVSPAHDLSLARALKSPLFGVSDADLVALALLRRQPQHAGRSWYALLQLSTPAEAGALASEVLDTPDAAPATATATATATAPAPEAQPALPAALRAAACTLAQYQTWVGALPPHDALAAIYHHGDVLARFAAATPVPLRDVVQANLRALLSAALNLEGGRYLTPYALVRAFRQGGMAAPVTADADAIRLLTIHGAKGLEAELVLLLDTDGSPPKPETMSLLVDWPGQAAVPRKLVFLASESHPPPCAAPALQAELTERQREELNALYVAMTRARQTLAISATQPHRASSGSAWQRIQPLAQPVQPVVLDAVPDAVLAESVPSTPLTVPPCVLRELPELPKRQTRPSATLLTPSASAPAAQATEASDTLRPDIPDAADVINTAQADAEDAAQDEATSLESPLESRMGMALHWLLETWPTQATTGADATAQHAVRAGHSPQALSWPDLSALAAHLPDLPDSLDQPDQSDQPDLPANLPEGAAPLNPEAEPPGSPALDDWPDAAVPGAWPSPAPAWGFDLQRLAQAAQRFELDTAMLAQAAQRARRILTGAGAWAWDAQQLDWSGNEVELNHQSRSLRIDRLVYRTAPTALAGWWVLDYKSAATPAQQPALLAQMRRYRQAVQAIYPGQRVWAAFLTGDGAQIAVDEVSD
jgi:ATP-dependent helicase/nuclease subunit A